ncbi:MAG: aspartyl protease family protein [Planctomycetota bacterium]|jgi:hypothetical protein
MLKNKGFLHLKTTLVLLLMTVVCATAAVRANRPGWKRQEVDWRMTGGSRIKAIHYPEDKTPPLHSTRADRPKKVPRKKFITKKAGSQPIPLAPEAATSIIANVIDSPPIDGFVPWIAVSLTDARYADDDAYAYDIDYTVGYFLTPTPWVDYAIGLYDTGASTSIMGYAASDSAGVFDKNLDGPATVELLGATGSVYAIVSYPLGLFIDSISSIKPDPNYPNDPNGKIEIDDLVSMVGEYNTSILLGQPPMPGTPDLPTAIGSPMSIFYAAHFQVDQPLTVTHNGQDFTGPNTTFHPWYDPCAPTYSNKVTLEVRPDGDAVAYFPWFDMYTFEYYPLFPSMIMGAGMQGLFFFPEVDLAEPNYSTTKSFMFDTGAQVTVIGSTLTARLELNDPDFYVEIIDVTGESTIVDGFFIDSIEIPADGEWLRFTNVPVIKLDVASPEGGYLDGIIGMNLFDEYNFVINGGGMLSPPYIEFEQIPYHIPADIAPPGGDDKVDSLDLADFTKAYLATSTSTNWNSKADMVSDAEINLYDFAAFAEYWGQQLAP